MQGVAFSPRLPGPAFTLCTILLPQIIMSEAAAAASIDVVVYRYRGGVDVRGAHEACE